MFFCAVGFIHMTITQEISLFLMFDYGESWAFTPTLEKRVALVPILNVA